ncbi:MAG: hypothetical protein ACRDPC_25290, partial [Solirubrobacteraceae bacterium]
VREIGGPVRAIVGPETAGIVPPDDRLPLPGAGGLQPTLARLLGGAVALQHLTLALVRARGVNPDLIRREQEPYRRAGEAAEGDW